MSTPASAPATPPAATPAPSISDKISAAFSKPTSAPATPAPAPKPSSADPGLPKTAPSATPPVEAKPAAAEPAAKPAPTLLPKKSAAPATPPAAEPAADPFESFTLPETATPESKSQFTELKRISREQAKRLKELEAKTTSPVVPAPEVEKLRAEHKAALDRLALLDLQSHPDFKRQYHEPKTKALAEVNEILAFAGKEGVDLAGLLTKDRKAFSAAVTELTKELNPMDATSVQSALRQAFQVTQEEKAALSKSGELHQRMQQQAEAQAKQAFEEVSANLGPVGEFMVTLDVPEGATADERAEIETYNAAVSNMRQRVEQKVFGPTNEKSMALMGWKSEAVDFLVNYGIPRMERTYAQVVAERDAMARELQALKGAKGSGPVAGDPNSSAASTKKSTEQMVAETFARR